MDVIFHSIDGERDAALSANDAADVFMQTVSISISDDGPAILGGKDNMVNQIDIRLGHSFFRCLSPTFVGWVDWVAVFPGLQSALASFHPGLYSRYPHSRVKIQCDGGIVCFVATIINGNSDDGIVLFIAAVINGVGTEASSFQLYAERLSAHECGWPE